MTAKGWQVLQVDYSNSNDLRFKLAGVDTVISTISGSPQLALIDAAAAARVRRFVPSEFGGPPSLRDRRDPTDNRRSDAIVRLAQHEPSGMRFAVFTCGVFYERFGPGGLAAFQIAVHQELGREGVYLLDMRRRRAQLPYSPTGNQSAYICMTSVRDVARFVVAALDLASWPREFRLRGDRLNVRQIVSTGEQVLGPLPFLHFSQLPLTNNFAGRTFEVSAHTQSSLQDALVYAQAVRDVNREVRLRQLIATAEGRLDFANTNLNQMIAFRPERFRDWLARVWIG